MKYLCLILALLGCAAVRAAEPPSGILFLHLRMTNGQVVLIDQVKTRGTLKGRGNGSPARGLQLELHSATGRTLWSHVIDDPASRRLEYEDPGNPGKILSREITLTNVDFTVRVPARADARSAVLYRRGPPVGKAVAPRRELARVTLRQDEAK